ncbi:hypothetical protein FE391_44075 [Nonomuraea sp. KC401]|uniref:DUF6069 family protein n=1 Tax=unclassified Nonomuraea TaxID=2593643 RepID=UPI0010FF4C6E|nr:MULTISPECIES: DUF6069 family protein [unclassified Nonomuraea]NBF00298.1 hypothetical protein [Nonomuraea sp. K271]TLF51859.1 hypothetical protein FE391_44075 [Nonomuraea sp. KC401]
MSVTTATATASTKNLIVGGLAATAAAAAATMGVAASGRLAGIGLAVGGAPIPLSGFATLTAIFSMLGLVLALILARTTRRPRVAFVRTTMVLTALSLVPDVLVDAPTATKVLLMLTHVVAAAIVVPVIARRLPA